MIKTITGTIQRSSHYGAHANNGREEFCLNVTIGLDAKEYNRIKKKHYNPIQSFLVSLKNIVWDAANINSVPCIGSASRASKGIKTIVAKFHMSKDKAAQLGADVSEWCLYHKIDLQSHLENNKENSLLSKGAMVRLINETTKH